ncbi:topoisomerase IV [Methanobrevibacter sp.]|uniref:topoisomerase IV n=1 Tax=Methanobrevibacter sp. TaxID=66852 RepID=UPI00386B92B2
MKDSKEKEHRISNLKDMINNIKENPKEHIFDDIEEDSELIDYLNKENEEYEELEIDDEFIYHPGDEDNDAINLEENNIDENFMIKTPADTEENSEEELDDDEFDSDLGEEFVDEISEGLDTIFNAKINRTPVIGVISSILGLIFIVLAATTFQSRSDRIIDNVMSGENSFIVVIFLIIGLFLLIYGLYRVFGLKNPLSTITSSIDSIQNDDEDVEKTEDEDKNIIPKSNIPLDKESYKIGEFNFDELKNNLKKPTASKPKTSPIEENIDDIPPAREKPEEKKGLTPDEIDEIEYQKAVLDNESIDDIFAEVEDIEDIPIISIDSEEEKKSE